MWTHSQGVFPLRADLAKAFGVDPKQVRCIHAEGSGCYGHNGADDVALDAALVARATGGKPVKLQWMREDEFAWEPYGSAMVMKLAGGIDAQGNVVTWSHELWSHPHSTRPGATPGVNLLAARYLAKPLDPGLPPDVPQPTGGADRNRSALRLRQREGDQALHRRRAATDVRAPHARRLRERVRARVVRRRASRRGGADPVEFRLRHTKDARSVQSSRRRRSARAGGRAPRATAPPDAASRSPVQEPRLLLRCRGRRRRRPQTGRVRVTKVVAAVDAGQIVNRMGS